MEIRIAQQADLPALLEIYNEEVVNGTATLDLHAKTLTERQVWFDAHNKDNHPLIVAVLNGVVAGYASLSDYREKEAYKTTVELSIYVSRAYRRQGIATALMAAILDMARADASTHAVVSVITSGNEASCKLHDKFGFTFCGTIPEVGLKFGSYLGIDNFFLRV